MALDLLLLHGSSAIAYNLPQVAQQVCPITLDRASFAKTSPYQSAENLLLCRNCTTTKSLKGE
jgi:hypothetical protein